MNTHLNTLHAQSENAKVTSTKGRGAVFWMTGLSGAGKSTLATALHAALISRGRACYVLDGDVLRQGLNSDLGFSPQDRSENIRRVAEVAALFADAGLICVVALISPYQADREKARKICGPAFHEIYVAATLKRCEERDPKGLYKKARSGELADFTGVGAPYQPPSTPELHIDTDQESSDLSTLRLLTYALDYLGI